MAGRIGVARSEGKTVREKERRGMGSRGGVFSGSRASGDKSGNDKVNWTRCFKKWVDEWFLERDLEKVENKGGEAKIKRGSDEARIEDKVNKERFFGSGEARVMERCDEMEFPSDGLSAVEQTTDEKEV